MKNNIFKIKTIILCKGIQASGKTTWAKGEMKRYPGKYKRINRDILREMLDNNEFSLENEDFITGLRDTIIERALMRSFDVILDEQNFYKSNWGSMCDIAKRVGNVRVMEKYFSIDLKTALKRNKNRPEPVIESAVINNYHKHIKNKRIEERDEFFEKSIPIYKEEDNSKLKAIIVDIDGTLALNTNRDYYDLSRVLEDTPNIPICNLVRLFYKNNYKIIAVSGRENISIEDTKIWLHANDIPFFAVFMREKGDNRKDAIIKEEIYLTHIKSEFDVRYVLDDRTQVVNDCWRKLNLCCLQVAPGDF